MLLRAGTGPAPTTESRLQSYEQKSEPPSDSESFFAEVQKKGKRGEKESKSAYLIRLFKVSGFIFVSQMSAIQQYLMKDNNNIST